MELAKEILKDQIEKMVKDLDGIIMSPELEVRLVGGGIEGYASTKYDNTIIISRDTFQKVIDIFNGTLNVFYK